MSVFFKNTCQYCRKNFYTLSDLILHIETDHLDFSPDRVKQLEDEKPECLPLSYVLKYNDTEDPPITQYSLKPELSSLNEAVIQEVNEAATDEIVTAFNNNYLCDFKEVKKIRTESRLSKEEFSQISASGNLFVEDKIKTVCRNKLFTLDNNHKKPFACNMKGCEKRYKNVNGIKYHYKKHHKMLIPTLKKSLLKQKALLNHQKPKHEKYELPSCSYAPQMSTDMYQNIQNVRGFEDCEALPSEYFYKFHTLPTSDVHFSSTQVPLPKTSFNYYNIAEIGDIEFSEKNSNFFEQNFDKI